jgi:electron transfer flavoprotein beta subunit
MKILVAIKQVPSRDSQLKVDAAGRWVDESDLTFEVNEPDAFALEEALRLREKHGGEVIALCAGPERAASSLREALAKGADRAVHVVERNLAAVDSLHLGQLLANIAAENFDLVLTGLQSDDFGSGRLTSRRSCSACRTPPSSCKWKAEGSIRVKRELEGGWFQHVEMPLPCVLTIQSGISRLRYATLMGIKRRRKSPVLPP